MKSAQHNAKWYQNDIKAMPGMPVKIAQPHARETARGRPQQPPHFRWTIGKIGRMHPEQQTLRSQIDGEVVGRFQRAGRNERDDPTIPSPASHRSRSSRIGFLYEHLRSRPGGDERMVS